MYNVQHNFIMNIVSLYMLWGLEVDMPPATMCCLSQRSVPLQPPPPHTQHFWCFWLSSVQWVCLLIVIYSSSVDSLPVFIYTECHKSGSGGDMAVLTHTVTICAEYNHRSPLLKRWNVFLAPEEAYWIVCGVIPRKQLQFAVDVTVAYFHSIHLGFQMTSTHARVTNTFCMIWGSHSGGYEEFCLLGYSAV
jgi:hypothetical protein